MLCFAQHDFAVCELYLARTSFDDATTSATALDHRHGYVHACSILVPSFEVPEKRGAGNEAIRSDIDQIINSVDLTRIETIMYSIGLHALTQKSSAFLLLASAQILSTSSFEVSSISSITFQACTGVRSR